jgi:hypothetical protein
MSAEYPTFTAWRRATNPRLRRTRPTAIRETGPRRTLIDCLCGASISYCTAWPVTRRVVVWRREHDLSCWPDGVPFQEYRRPDPYGQDEADGAACRAMAAALALVRQQRPGAITNVQFTTKTTRRG